MRRVAIIVSLLLIGCAGAAPAASSTQSEYVDAQAFTQKEFAIYNHLYFNDKLPANTHIVVVDDCTTDEYAEAETLTPAFTGKPYYIIEISAPRNPEGNEALMTLLHEMVHVYLFSTIPDYHGDHGLLFQHKMLDLAEQHAFDDLW